MKLYTNNNSIRALGFVLTVTFMLSFGSCDNKKVRQSNSGKGKDESICSIHNLDCKNDAVGMGMSLEEYHKWKEDLAEEINAEDENTNAEGDIVDPNATDVQVAPSSNERQKQWVNCSECHGTGVRNCYNCHGKGEVRCGYCRGNGVSGYNNATCFQCHGSGITNCYDCKGHGNFNCSPCGGKGQVLETY